MADQNNALENALWELVEAQDFYDRVVDATESERIAVGSDHHERLDKATRRVVRLARPGFTRADRAASEGQVQCCMCGRKDLSTIEGDGGEECQLWDGRWTCSRGCYDKACMIHEAALTPPSAAPTDNTALVEALQNMMTFARSKMDDPTRADDMRIFKDAHAALASREAPPASQQEAVTVAEAAAVLLKARDAPEDKIEKQDGGTYWMTPEESQLRLLDAIALRALKGENE